MTTSRPSHRVLYIPNMYIVVPTMYPRHVIGPRALSQVNAIPGRGKVAFCDTWPRASSSCSACLGETKHPTTFDRRHLGPFCRLPTISSRPITFTRTRAESFAPRPLRHPSRPCHFGLPRDQHVLPDSLQASETTRSTVQACVRPELPKDFCCYRSSPTRPATNNPPRLPHRRRASLHCP